MNRIFASLLLFCAISLVAPQSVSAVAIEWSPVGNPGNANDPATGNLYGGVGYNYKIGTYDVTNSQYDEFLNTKDPTGANALDLWHPSMANATYGGISFNGGNSPGSKYVLTVGRQNHPVNFVPWYAAIRFANWLDNGQGSGDTETGAYTLGELNQDGTPVDGFSITRNAGATVFLPSEDEWYKAAYYDPNSSRYNLYPTGSNSAPTASGPTALGNYANYNNAVGNLTDVGAYTGTTSPYGAFDMGGNVYQWNERVSISFPVPGRAARGGSYNSNQLSLRSSFENAQIPEAGVINFGFRLASIPEPSTGVLAIVGCALMWILRKRFK